MEERLQKIIARSGLASRRKAEEMIHEGRVSVNSEIVRKFGAKADVDRDEIRVDGKLICAEETKTYLMLNKPRGYVTTLHDPQKRPMVISLLPELGVRLFPVGRLDYDSEGLLLMTNDGRFAQHIQHPRYRISKTYRVKISGRLNTGEFRRLQSGLDLEDGKFIPDEISLEEINPKSTWLTLKISEGRNRVIRRAFEQLGRPVLRLIRTAVADLQLGSLGEGDYRFLKGWEIRQLLSPRKKSGSLERSREGK
ncbi:MAG: Ribosomal large subunit pseudouridine synthase B [Syntrophus sp. PtaU1.Bin208]|nr:MAG: Ribosomal large subunit pseudouridine synthase B [Syntrophus sp. PtaU1.Bin208]